MTTSCCNSPETRNSNREVPFKNEQRVPPAAKVCPVCGVKGKSVQGQTVKALLNVSLRNVQANDYFFCRTQNCPVAYYSLMGEQTFSIDQVREPIYQKEPENLDVFVCYCFQHKLKDIQTATPEGRNAILEDINGGIARGQCACDIRNPQGACCLGNVSSLTKKFAIQEANPPGD